MPGKKPTRLQTLYFSALGCVPSSSSSIEADPNVAASLILIFVLFACLVGFHPRGESDFVRLESSGRFLLPPSLMDGRDHTDFVSSHRYATKAFQDDNALKPMGLYVREKGKALSEGRYEVAIYKLLREFGDDENAGSGDEGEEKKKKRKKKVVVDVAEEQPTRRTLSGPRVHGFKLIGHEVRASSSFFLLLLLP